MAVELSEGVRAIIKETARVTAEEVVSRHEKGCQVAWRVAQIEQSRSLLGGFLRSVLAPMLAGIGGGLLFWMLSVYRGH